MVMKKRLEGLDMFFICLPFFPSDVCDEILYFLVELFEVFSRHGIAVSSVSLDKTGGCVFHYHLGRDGETLFPLVFLHN